MSIENDYKLFVGERIDPAMLSVDFLLNQPKHAYSNKRRTPWGIWHTFKIHKSRYQFTKDHLCLEQGSKVLDLACGTGYGGNVFKDVEWVGVDISNTALKFGYSNNRTSERMLFVNGDATNLPFETSTFDAVTSFETMEHLPLGNVSFYLNEVKRVLKPGGKFAISVPNREFSTFDGSLNSVPVNPFHYFEPNFEELQNILNPHFINIEYYYQTGRYLKPENKILAKFVKGVNVLNNEYSDVKDIKLLDSSLEIPSVFLAVGNNC